MKLYLKPYKHSKILCLKLSKCNIDKCIENVPENICKMGKSKWQCYFYLQQMISVWTVDLEEKLM